MCGFAAILSSSGESRYEEICKMSSSISHRGPDDEGYCLINDINNIYPVGGKDTHWDSEFLSVPYYPISEYQLLTKSSYKIILGHRRLSILDLSPLGHMPMSYGNNRYWITYNGEIYNYLEIKLELEALGHTFVSNTDTEVILASYVQWGIDCLDHFNGMWSFIIYDVESEDVFISRDRFGIKPFYYWHSPNGNWYFGSEIKEFVSLDSWTAKLNPQRAWDYLAYSLTDHTEETMYQGVFQLQCGHYALFNINRIPVDAQGRLKTMKWYNLPFVPFEGTYEEAVDIFKDLFLDSIKLHLRSDVEVGSALSGGVDSSSIVCVIDQLLKRSGGKQKTFSSCSLDNRYDESSWMKEVIDCTSVEPHYVYPQLADFYKQTEDIIWHQEEPYQSQSAFLGYNVFKCAKESGVSVLLNGQGADEYLGGYGQFTGPRYASLIKNFHFYTLWSDYCSLKKNETIDRRRIIRQTVVNMLPESYTAYLEKKIWKSRTTNLFDLEKLGASHIHHKEIIPVGNRSIQNIIIHALFKFTLPRLLRWEDRNSMAFSVEARVPFLDYRLIEFIYSLPSSFLDKNGVTKRILRDSMSGIIPDKIRDRKDKKGFITPEERWIKEDATSFFRKKVEEAIDGTMGIIKPGVLSYFDSVVSGKVPFDYTYWRIILFSEWMKKFNIAK